MKNENEYPVIEITYDYKKPLNLLEFSDSLKAIHNLHDGQDYELQIKDVREGSIVLDLINIDPSMIVGMAPMLPEVVEKTHNFVKYVTGTIKMLKDGVFVRGDGKEITKKEANACHDIVATTAKDPGSNFIIHAGDNATFNIDYMSAGVTQNNASKWIKHLEERDNGIEMNAFLLFTKFSNNHKVGNKAIVEDVSTSEVTTRFATEEIYNEMVRKVDKPFDHIWDVNIHVEKLAVSEKAVRYTILAVNDELTSK